MTVGELDQQGWIDQADLEDLLPVVRSPHRGQLRFSPRGLGQREVPSLGGVARRSQRYEVVVVGYLRRREMPRLHFPRMVERAVCARDCDGRDVPAADAHRVQGDGNLLRFVATELLSRGGKEASLDGDASLGGLRLERRTRGAWQDEE